MSDPNQREVFNYKQPQPFVFLKQIQKNRQKQVNVFFSCTYSLTFRMYMFAKNFDLKFYKLLNM